MKRLTFFHYDLYFFMLIECCPCHSPLLSLVPTMLAWLHDLLGYGNISTWRCSRRERSCFHVEVSSTKHRRKTESAGLGGKSKIRKIRFPKSETTQNTQRQDKTAVHPKGKKNRSQTGRKGAFLCSSVKKRRKSAKRHLLRVKSTSRENSLR